MDKQTYKQKIQVFFSHEDTKFILPMAVYHLGVIVFVGVIVGVTEDVTVGVGVEVVVEVTVGVGVDVLVGVTVGVFVIVGVIVMVTDGVGVIVIVGVTEGVGDGPGGVPSGTKRATISNIARFSPR